MSNPGSTNPTDHMKALYDEEELIIKDEPVVKEDTSDDEGSNSSVILPWDMDGDTDSNMADARALSPLPPYRSRSRSPVWVEIPPRPSALPSSSSAPQATFQNGQTSGADAVVIRQFDPDGTSPNPTEEDFLTPDQHRIFEFTESPSEPRSMDASTRGSRRRRGRGSRGGGNRGRGNRQRSKPNAAARSVPRHPITEIYLTDNDLPAELIELVQSVIRQREVKEANCKRVREEEDVYKDAEDWKDMFTVVNEEFEWKSMESFRPTEELFKPERTGATVTHSSAYSAFRSYWDDEILSHIVRETNAYAAKITADGFQSKWVPTNIHEVLVLFGFWIMLGIIRMPTYTSCFSRDPLLETTVFRRMFTCKRYEFLVRALRFDSNDEFPPKNDQFNEDDPIAKIRPILTHLNTKFQASYTPSKNICIDESLLLWTGSLNFRRSFQSRPKDAQRGIKTYEVCESATGYLWSFFVSTGKHSSLDTGRYSKLRKSTAAVLSLMEPLLNKGYRLFMDHLFNSPYLARFLKRNGTDCVGTLQPDQEHVPPLLNICELENGQMIGRHSGDVCVMAWQGKDKFTTISTCHGLEQGLSAKNVYKPQVVLDYKKHKGGVDLKDEMLEPYLLERKRCYRWYMKLFKRLLNCSIFNSQILLASSTAQHQDHLDFRLRLVDEILNNHLSLCPLFRSPEKPRTPSSLSSRLHWPTYLPDTPGYAGLSQHTRKRCVWCAVHGPNNQKKSIFMCEECKVPLCVIECFKNYHLSL